MALPRGLRLSDRVRVKKKGPSGEVVFDGAAKVRAQRTRTDEFADAPSTTVFYQIVVHESAWVDAVAAERGRFDVIWVRGGGLSQVALTEVQSVSRGAGVADIVATERHG